MRFLKVFISAMFTFLFLGNVVFASTTVSLSGIQKGVGTWLWKTDLIVNETPQIISFLNQNGIDEVYLQIKKSIPNQHYKNFIRTCNENNISVSALDGSASFATPEGAYKVDAFFEWLSNYQSTAEENEKFHGVHLDVEPYLTTIWKENTPMGILYYQQFVVKARGLSDTLELPFGVDIPFWFDSRFYDNEFGVGNLAEWVIQITDSVNLMSYRDKASKILPIVETELQYGKLYNKKVVVSVNTKKSSEGNYTTFYEEGATKMNEELLALQDMLEFKEYDFSFAIHSYSHFLALKD